MSATVPVTLFAYARPDHLRRTLECLRENEVPLIYAFSDGPGSPDKEPAVGEVREMLRRIDWSEVVLCERESNLGLGRSILTGVSDLLREHDAAIIVEDDLICVPGTYDYLCRALKRYRDNPRVMCVTGWTHPRATPRDVTDRPYFDGRAECWIWGTWARAWQGMQEDARTLMQMCQANGIDIYRYGADLPSMAEAELKKNIWAVRFAYWQILNQGLCLRPPWSMVDHIGFDADGTNATEESWIKNTPLRPCPPVPREWPEALENAECTRLWRAIYGGRPNPVTAFARRQARRVATALSCGRRGGGDA